MSAIEPLFHMLSLAVEALEAAGSRAANGEHARLQTDFSTPHWEEVPELSGPAAWHERLRRFEADIAAASPESRRYRRLCWYHDAARAKQGHPNFSAAYTDTRGLTAVTLYICEAGSTVTCRTVLGGRRFIITREEIEQDEISGCDIQSAATASATVIRGSKASKQMRVQYYARGASLTDILALHHELLAAGPWVNNSIMSISSPDVYMEHSRWLHRLHSR